MVRSFPKAFHMIALSLATLLASAGSALAQSKADEVNVDARLEGYSKPVALEGSTATMWMLLMLLTIIALGVLFKNANRSHLD